MTKPKSPSVAHSSSQQLDSFIEQIKKAPIPFSSANQGRVLFALDATASRQPTWDQACHLQNEMFVEAGKVGKLNLQLCYFRGYNEFYNSTWLQTSHQLSQIMSNVFCSPGHTQIRKVLQLALTETRKQQIQAVIYIGDSMEENLDTLCQSAGELGLLSTPVFLFQEGTDLVTKRAMKEIARLSGGAYHSFNMHSSSLLKQLLTAVAIYATGGKPALENYAHRNAPEVIHLLQQLK